MVPGWLEWAGVHLRRGAPPDGRASGRRPREHAPELLGATLLSATRRAGKDPIAAASLRRSSRQRRTSSTGTGGTAEGGRAGGGRGGGGDGGLGSSGGEGGYGQVSSERVHRGDRMRRWPEARRRTTWRGGLGVRGAHGARDACDELVIWLRACACTVRRSGQRQRSKAALEAATLVAARSSARGSGWVAGGPISPL